MKSLPLVPMPRRASRTGLAGNFGGLFVGLSLGLVLFGGGMIAVLPLRILFPHSPHGSLWMKLIADLIVMGALGFAARAFFCSREWWTGAGVILIGILASLLVCQTLADLRGTPVVPPGWYSLGSQVPVLR